MRFPTLTVKVERDMAVSAEDKVVFNTIQHHLGQKHLPRKHFWNWKGLSFT